MTGSLDVSGLSLDETPLALWRGFKGRLEQARVGIAPPVFLPVLVSSQAGPGATAEERFVEFSFQPVREGSGMLLRIAVHGSDVTARVLRERELNASNERSEAILEALGDGFVVFDEEFRVTRLNPVALRYDGRQADAIIG
ncbi:PAS domain-containing protein [Microvirga makkahensis]|uniref:PAS domain-containing protein n=1 Tax=Microvirga makkahensis TaxID=1128670 RepID=A0A7X3SQD0_9HYPH|nr:PAS domain-containing protein [Microvirga makkahensis]MXQ12964.1 hypothetical protein [Microvirga makkahensis]